MVKNNYLAQIYEEYPTNTDYIPVQVDKKEGEPKKIRSTLLVKRDYKPNL